MKRILAQRPLLHRKASLLQVLDQIRLHDPKPVEADRHRRRFIACCQQLFHKINIVMIQPHFYDPWSIRILY